MKGIVKREYFFAYNAKKPKHWFSFGDMCIKIVIKNLDSSLLRISNRFMAYISLECLWKGGHLAGGNGGGLSFHFQGQKMIKNV